MKKMTLISLITLTIGLSLVILGAVFASITTWGAGFNPGVLADTFQSIGYVIAAFSGIVLTAIGVSSAVNEKGK